MAGKRKKSTGLSKGRGMGRKPKKGTGLFTNRYSRKKGKAKGPWAVYVR